MPERDFFNFWIFLLFFSEFSCPGLEWSEFGTKFFFFVVLGLSHPVSAKNNAGIRFFNFLNFLAIFFRIFYPGPSMNGIRDESFFPSFSVYLIPFWLKIIPERGFFIFWIFLLFFCPGRVWTEFGTKSNAEKWFFNFFNFFSIFSEISSSGRVWTKFGTKIFFPLFRPISSRPG